MRQIFLLFFAIACLCIKGYSITITPEEAMHRARETGMRKTRGLITQNLQLSYTLNTEKNEAAAYIFNSSNNKGFIILSAEDLIAPILGYSDSGKFDPNNIPEQMKWWLEQYANQIEYARSLNITSTGNNPTNIEWKDIAPMITTRWGQGEPFNNDCPTDPTTGKRCVTGCVATAMAQIVNYWKQPERGIGLIEYTPYDFNSPLKLDLSAQKFDWNNMKDKYELGNYNETQAEAISYLMKACGYSVSMNYSSHGSWASVRLLSGGLINYFGYNNNISYEERDYYSSDEWNQMVYDELAAGRPILYMGQSDIVAHEFICDGFYDGFFHINWGWEGIADGYFRLEALDPSYYGIKGSVGNGYNYNQVILKCVQPTECDNPDSFGMVQRGNLTASIEGSKICPIISGAPNPGIWYYQNSTIDIYMIMEITPLKNPNNKQYVGLYSLKNMGPKTYIGVTRLPSFDLPDSLEDGTYRCRLIVRNVSNSFLDFRYVKHRPGSAYYFDVIKSGDNLSVENMAVDTFKLDELSLNSKLYYQCTTSLNATFSNSSDTEVSVPVVPVITSSDGKELFQGESISIVLAAGEKKTFNIKTVFTTPSEVSAPTMATDGILRFKNRITEEYYKTELPVTIKVNKSISASVSNFKISGAEKKNIDSNTFGWVVTNPDEINTTFSITSQSEYFGYPIFLAILDGTTNRAFEITELSLPELETGKSKSANASISFPSGEDNRIYKIVVMYRRLLNDGQLGYTFLTQSYMTVKRSSDVNEIEEVDKTATEYYDLHGHKLNQAPEKGIYFIKQGLKVSKVIR